MWQLNHLSLWQLFIYRFGEGKLYVCPNCRNYIMSEVIKYLQYIVLKYIYSSTGLQYIFTILYLSASI